MKDTFERLENLRQDLFDAIDHAIEMDGHHKSYEGQLSIQWPHRFTDKYIVSLDCYVIGPGRHNYWESKTLVSAFDKAEKDIRKWIKDEYDFDYSEE